MNDEPEDPADEEKGFGPGLVIGLLVGVFAAAMTGAITNNVTGDWYKNAAITAGVGRYVNYAPNTFEYIPVSELKMGSDACSTTFTLKRGETETFSCPGDAAQK